MAEAATTLPLAVARHGGGRGRGQEGVAQSQSPEKQLLTCRPPGPSAAAGGPGTVLTLNIQEEACSGSGREGAGVGPARSGTPVPPVEGGPSPSQPLNQPAGGSSRAEDTPKGGQSCRPSTDQTRQGQHRPPQTTSRKTGFQPPGRTHGEMRQAEGPMPPALSHGCQSHDLTVQP